MSKKGKLLFSLNETWRTPFYYKLLEATLPMIEIISLVLTVIEVVIAYISTKI